MDHTINETELVPRKQAKLRFRESILYEWDYCCAYCGDPLGKNATTQKNLVGCCFSCNSHKSGHDWIEWYRQRDYWLPDREERIARWLEQ
jgi:5-methylcytosine-specific restriction endonuclease McrA